MQSVTKSDATAIAELEIELFPENSFNERTIAREIAAGGGLVVYEGELLVAYLLVRWDWEIMDITRVGVRASHQGQGIGKKLIVTTISNSSLDPILCVHKDNKPARHLYQSLGFNIIGQLKHSWVMRKFRT